MTEKLLLKEMIGRRVSQAVGLGVLKKPPKNPRKTRGVRYSYPACRATQLVRQAQPMSRSVFKRLFEG
jgi:hypothetical protein